MQLNEIGRILRNICSIVPGGVVCFLPSYSYEQTIYEHLKTNKVLEAISKKKTVFREPKSASEVDQVINFTFLTFHLHVQFKLYNHILIIKATEPRVSKCGNWLMVLEYTLYTHHTQYTSLYYNVF